MREAWAWDAGYLRRPAPPFAPRVGWMANNAPQEAVSGVILTTLGAGGAESTPLRALPHPPSR